MSEPQDRPGGQDPSDPGYRVPSILVVAFGMTYLVITASWTALVGRSTTLGSEGLSGPMIETMLLMNTGGPLIMIIGVALRRVRGSPVRQSLIAICLTGLWFYGKFMSGLFS